MANRKNSHRRRVRVAVLMVLCGAVFAAFFARLAWMQFVRADYYADKAAEASSASYTVTQHAARGAIVDSGNELMNHSNAHDHYNSLTADQIIADVNTCNDKIEALTGVRPTLIRCPFGEYDDHVISTIRSIGMEPIQWDVEALAAVGTARGASDMRAPYSSSCSGRCRSAGHSKKLIM